MPRHSPVSARGIPSTTGVRGPLWPILLLCAAVVVAYSNSFQGEFIFDDIPSIHENRSIQSPTGLRDIFWPGVDRGRTVDGRPLVNASLALNYAIGQQNVVGYHLFNLLVHLGAVLSLYGLVRQTLLLPKLRPTFSMHATGIGLAVALLWGLHPLNTSAVTYIVQRAESMVGLFYLLTLYCVARGEGSRRPVIWWCLAVASCLAGMATKEVMVSAPIVVLLYLWAFVFDSFVATLRARGPLLISLSATWLLLAALVIANAGRGGSVDVDSPLSPIRYGIIQVAAIGQYLKLAFVPRPLILDYGKLWDPTAGQLFLGGVLICLLALVTVLGLFRWRWAGFLGLAFFLILAPSSSILPIITQVAAEHRMYLPLAAVICGAVVLVHLGVSRWRQRSSGAPVGSLARWAPAVALLMIALSLGVQTWARNQDYLSAVSIWTDTAEKRPGNPRAHSHLATFALEAGNYRQAVEHFNRVAELSPDDPNTYFLRGVVYLQLEEYALAKEDFDRCISLRPEFAEAWQNRGVALLKMNQHRQAEQDFTQAMQRGPTLVNAYRYRALAYWSQGRVEAAQADAREFVRRGGHADEKLQDILASRTQ